MLRKVFNILAILALMAGFLYSGNVMAQDNVGPDSGTDTVYQPVSKKPIDEPNPQDYLRNEARAALIRQENKGAEASSLALTGKDKVLVILVEFAGLDTFTWTKGVSTWDPLNRSDPTEGTGITQAGDCSNINAASGDYSYSGPMHNQIPTPVSQADASGVYIWTQDFNPKWFQDFMFGNGVKINYQRVDGSVVKEDFTGKSVRNYYLDMSNGLYDMDGTVVGWLQMPHSAMWYANNQCPGAKSGAPANLTIGHYGGNIPGAGSTRSLTKDALDAVNAKIAAGELPGFNWKDYDLDGDGDIDRLWVVHAGYGEESDTTLLNRTNYGEGIPWSHSTSGLNYEVDPVNHIKANAYIMMPESGGINVFAHEAGHNLGAVDLYTYGNGNTSAGFWTLMSDSWTGYPIAFQPPAMDPMHLDLWGWLNPTVITDPSKVYTVTLQQPATGPSPVPDGAVKGVRIDLPDGQVPQPVPVWQGEYYWFGGKANRLTSQMTLSTPLAIPAAATAASLTFDLAYDTEPLWDYLWIQASDDNGATWKTLTNGNTTCNHDPDWIGEQQGFPRDMCAAGVGGFTGRNPGFPAPQAQTFNLSTFVGKSVLVRFWYMTDTNTLGAGPFMDNVEVTAAVPTADGGTVLLADDAETENTTWTYASIWARNNGFISFDQSFYIQWRNTNANGGYDSTLGDVRWRYGKANTGMVVWYNNMLYANTEIEDYLFDYPSFGPKGKMLVVDANPEPYRFPSKVANYPNEGAALNSRGMMRDAPFTLSDSVNFMYPDNGVPTFFAGRPAVKTFHDSMGYYPGAEFTKRSPIQTDRWVTKQWDSSVVLPSKSAYALKAPGYVGTGGTGANEFRWNCAINAASGALGCSWFGPGVGLGYNGGNGNPADVNGQYGWHIELIEESPDHSWARVRIWNSQYAMDSALTPNKVRANVGDTLTYTAAFKNTGSTATFLACAAIDTSKETYVAGSATGSPIELPSCPVAGADMVVDPTAPVGALVWQLNNVIPGSVSSFTYDVTAVKSGQAKGAASIISFPPNASIYSSQTIKPVLIGQLNFAPLVTKP